jgi:hypothetical protein
MTCRIHISSAALSTLLLTTTLVSQSAARDDFPRQAFGNVGDDFYAQALAMMQEPALAATGSDDREVYRFLWAPAFHGYAVVRVERTGTRVVLAAKRLGRDPRTGEFTKLDHPVQKTLTDKQWRILTGQLTAARFWSMPSDEPMRWSPGGIELFVVDGDSWILEGADAMRHHGAARRFHEDDRAFETACYCMLYWSGLDKALSDIDRYGQPDPRRRLAWACNAEPPKTGGHERPAGF